jgi:phage terminase large subunit GpA-like protein
MEADRVFLPPPNLTVSQWADAERKLGEKTNAEPGDWRTDRNPMMREPMDCCSDPLVREVTFVAARQVGKTSSLVENVVGYYMDQDPAQIGVFFENQDKADGWSKERLMAMVEDTPCLREKLSFGKGAGDSKNTISFKDYPGGFLVILSAGSDANVASRSLRIIIKDELSKYPVTKLGDTAERIDALSTTFFNAKIINLTTPTIKAQPVTKDETGEAGFCRGTARYLESDQRLPYLACPFCGHYQVLREAQLKFTRPGNAGNIVDDVWYECENPACGIKKIRHVHKQRMLEGGKWIAQRPFRGHAGFAGYSALYSPWVTWEKYANAKLRMWRQIDTRKTFVNEWRGEAWDELMAVDKDISVYTKRCENYDKVPLRAAIGVGYVDLQADRLEAEVKFYGEGRESFGMGHKIFYGDVAKLTTGPLPQFVQDMFIFLSQTWEHESGAMLRVQRVFIDMGYAQHIVLRLCKGRRGSGIWPSKGMSDIKAALVTRRPVKSVKDKILYFPIGPNAGKEIVLANMELEEEGPGYMHFRRGHYDDEYFKQVMLSERYKWIKGVKVYEKISTSSRNEGLDLCVGCLAAYESLNVDPKPYVDALRRRWEERQKAEVTIRQETPEEDRPEPRNQQQKPINPAGRRRGGWVNWRT